MRRLLTPLLIVAALALSACAGGDGADPETDGTATPTADPSPTSGVTPTPEGTATGDGGAPGGELSTTTCDNPEDGYAVDYPAEWHVNDPGSPTEPCRVFDPEPFQLEPGTEIPQNLAVVIDVEPVAMERMQEGDEGSEVLQRDELTIAGRDAVLLETRAGEDAPLQEPGTISYRYLVRLGPERTFVARTTDRGDTPYADKQRVLDRMVSTVEFFEPSPTPSP